MKLVNTYQTITLESSLTKAELQRAAKYVPDSLTLVDEHDDPYFVIDFVNPSKGSIDTYGVAFDSVTAEDKPYVTLVDNQIPTATAARQTYLEDNFGTTLFKLGQVEAQIRVALDAHADQIASVSEAITLN